MTVSYFEHTATRRLRCVFARLDRNERTPPPQSFGRGTEDGGREEMMRLQHYASDVVVFIGNPHNAVGIQFGRRNPVIVAIVESQREADTEIRVEEILRFSLASQLLFVALLSFGLFVFRLLLISDRSLSEGSGRRGI